MYRMGLLRRCGGPKRIVSTEHIGQACLVVGNRLVLLTSQPFRIQTTFVTVGDTFCLQSVNLTG